MSCWLWGLMFVGSCRAWVFIFLGIIICKYTILHFEFLGCTRCLQLAAFSKGRKPNEVMLFGLGSFFVCFACIYKYISFICLFTITNGVVIGYGCNYSLHSRVFTFLFLFHFPSVI
uniref:Uncharacterized protein n=1 Tax=Trypanosoma congolense (strain IL3000) TaxID=1068625 RepID=G0UMU9_TRYCI|nr:hypothetical protein, unlikely [Trypanosoma congolense IL3000]